MFTPMEKHLLRERIRYKKTHYCFWPKYVVEDRSRLRKFTRADIPSYIWIKIKKFFLGTK